MVSRHVANKHHEFGNRGVKSHFFYILGDTLDGAGGQSCLVGCSGPINDGGQCLRFLGIPANQSMGPPAETETFRESIQKTRGRLSPEAP